MENIIILKSGDKIPVDCLYLDGNNLQVNNSMQTGESEPVKISDQFRFLLSGAFIEAGNCNAVTCAVGVNTQSGMNVLKIQSMDSNEELTSLQQKLQSITTTMAYVGLIRSIVTVIVFRFSIWIEVQKKALGKQRHV
jgi:P-type E1-E2 ATPase